MFLGLFCEFTFICELIWGEEGGVNLGGGALIRGGGLVSGIFTKWRDNKSTISNKSTGQLETKDFRIFSGL